MKIKRVSYNTKLFIDTTDRRTKYLSMLHNLGIPKDNLEKHKYPYLNNKFMNGRDDSPIKILFISPLHRNKYEKYMDEFLD